MDSVSTFDVDGRFLEVCGITRSNDPTSRTWPYTHEPQRLAFTTSLLQEYATGFTPTGDVADLPVQVRINAILIMSLAFAKKKVLNRANAQQVSAAEDRLRTLFWGHEQAISLPEPAFSGCEIRRAAIHYVLWYGDPGELETNLVAIRVDQPLDVTGDEISCLSGLAATSMVHHYRNTQPVLEDTYGIVTDGLRWVFFHIGERNKYSCLNLNWLEGEGQQRAIVGVIGEILDRAVTAKMTCVQTELNRLPWTLDWSTMASTWETPRRGCLGEWDEDEILVDDSPGDSLHSEFEDDDGQYISAFQSSGLFQSHNSLPPRFHNITSHTAHSIPSLSSPTDSNIQPSFSLHETNTATNMEWINKLEAEYNELMKRFEAGGRLGDFKTKMNSAFSLARTQSEKEAPAPTKAALQKSKGFAGFGKKAKPVESVAVGDIKLTDVMSTFKLRHESRQQGAPPHWNLSPAEMRNVSPHLRQTLDNIRLVYGQATQNEAVIRLIINAILLEVMATVKRLELGQYGAEKGQGKRSSTDSTASGKSVKLALETPIQYVFNTNKGKKNFGGRMDYTLWYGPHEQAEAYMAVVEAKSPGQVKVGTYQAISYMALIQDARRVAGRVGTPLYGVSSDGGDWEFVRMDARGNVDIERVSWASNQETRIISILHKIIKEASLLTPVSSLSRQDSVQEKAGLTDQPYSL
ncbi:hypothetical protein BJY00DRAFT_312403 [Aspergillus carlsbadensis]|nr:hypothetical protein BJY00DRAFT_312403 [Aspergillus carlsbadensis]